MRGQVTWTIQILVGTNYQPYLWNGWSYSGQILHTGRLCQVPAYWWQITLDQGHVTHFQFWAPNMLSLEWFKLESSNFAYKENVLNPSPVMEGAWWASHDPFSISMLASISPERLKRESPNLYAGRIYQMLALEMTDYPLMGVVRVT